jgi:hypothetical protein
MSEPLLASTFLFRFSVPCRRCDPLWSAEGLELGPHHALPSFGELEGRPKFADLRTAWSEDGLLFTLRVSGKRQNVWCRSSRIEDSDGLHVWIDTRDTHNIHRASRFCHRFAFLPTGGGSAENLPLGRLLVIDRARENPKSVADSTLRVRAVVSAGGYTLQAHIPAAALTGFEPLEHPRLGFTYAVVDRELGWQTFSMGPEFPIDEDPSLWGSLELVGEDGASGRSP